MGGSRLRTKAKGPIALLLCAAVWGFAFSAQSNAMHHMGPYTFVFLRSLITCCVLVTVMPLLRRPGGGATSHSLKAHLKVGIPCGAFLVLATLLQQIGLVTTIPAKSGFITALYIIIVPVIGLLFGRRPPLTVWLGALVSMAGLYLLCMKGAIALSRGDLVTLGSALVFAMHITLVDRHGGSLDPLLLSAVQFACCAVIAGALAFTLEEPSPDGILACWKDILYVSVFSGAIGYTLQIVGQRYTEPTTASLLMCLESVFAAVGGWLLLGDVLSARELLGCFLMLSASVLALLPERRRA